MIFKYIFKDKVRAVFLILIGIINAVAVTGLALVYGNLVNVVAAGADVSELLKAALYSLAYTVLTGGMNWLEHYFGNVFFMRFCAALQNEYFKNIINSQFGVIAKEDSSKYFTSINNDIGRVRWSAWMLFSITKTGVSIISAFLAAVYLSAPIALIMVALTVFLGILPFFIKKKLDKQTMVCSDAEKVYSMSLKENLQGAAIIKAFSAENAAVEKVADANAKLLVENRKKSFIDAFAGGAGVIIQNISILALVGVTCYFVIIKMVEIGAVLSIVQIGMGFYGGMLGLAATLTNYWGCSGIRKRVFGVLSKKTRDISVETLVLKDGIEFKNVSFKYSGNERAAVQDISLILEKDKKYLILGKSGSGKSTILKLIAKFYDVSEGEITIDGENYSRFSEKEITKVVAVALQNCYLFNRSLKENIDFLDSGDLNRLNRVIELCALKDFTERLPDGLNTKMDEEVNQVSGGEKLRINLARALYRDSDILLLDEVTSALDKTTSSVVENNLLALSGKTIVNVCHKFNDTTLRLYDKIFIVEDGRLTACGSYEELSGGELLNRYRNVETAA